MQKTRFIRFTVLLILCCLIASCSNLSKTHLQNTEATPKQLRSNQIIIALHGENKAHWPDIKTQLVKKHKLQMTGEFFLESINLLCLVYQFDAKDKLPALIKTLTNNPNIELVQTNALFQSTSSEDKYYALQAGFQFYPLHKLHQFSTGKNIRIAVIDTGTDFEHPEIKHNIIETKSFVENGMSDFQEDIHGTAVTGIIAAQPYNQQGIHGIAPDAQIHALKACWYSSKTTHQAHCSSWSLAKALDFAIIHNMDVINMSLAGPMDKLLYKIVDAGIRKNQMIVAAVNETLTHQLGFPASHPKVFAVISSDDNGKISFDHSSAQKTLFKAPGKNIISLAPGNEYDFYNGSSLATAHLSGLLALFKQLDSGDQIKNWPSFIEKNSNLNQSVAQLKICDIAMQLTKEHVC